MQQAIKILKENGFVQIDIEDETAEKNELKEVQRWKFIPPKGFDQGRGYCIITILDKVSRTRLPDKVQEDENGDKKFIPQYRTSRRQAFCVSLKRRTTRSYNLDQLKDWIKYNGYLKRNKYTPNEKKAILLANKH